jgi:hypothetical protein
MSKKIIYQIIIAILGVLTGYQAGNPNSIAWAYLLPGPHEEVPKAYVINEPELP